MSGPSRREPRRRALAAIVRGELGSSGLSATQRERVAGAVADLILMAGGSDSTIDLEFRLSIASDRVHVRVGQRDRLSGEPKDSRPTFATWFQDLLKRRGMTQGAAAREIGVSLKTVNRWATGETEPRLRELSLLREALGELPASLVP